MSRNGSGVMSVPNTLVAGTTITASDHNENYEDIADELTNSVAADGQTSMTGPLKLSNGTVAAPAWTFASDTDSGGYRIGANNIGIAVNGAKVLDIATTGLAVTGTFSSTGALTVTAGGLTISAGGAAITGNSSIVGTFSVTGATTAAAITASGLVTASAGATIVSGLTVSSGGYTVTGNSSITGTLTLSSSLAITSGGATISAGGLTVNAGGAAVVGTSSFTSGTLSVGKVTGYDMAQAGTTFEGQRMACTGSGEVLHLCRQGNGTSVVFYDAAGSTGRGSISHVNDASTAYNTSSDARLKKDARPIRDGLAVINKLLPTYFNWKCNGSPDFGFIAQEVYAVDPRLVTGSPNGGDLMGMDYSRPMAFVVAAIQELSKRLDALEAR